MEEKGCFLLLEGFTTPQTSSQQVSILLKEKTRQMQDTHSSLMSEMSSAGCVYHERVMKSNTDSFPPFLLLRWPCCDGAKRSEEYRQFRSTAGLIFTLLYHDPGLISSDATIRLTARTETLLTQRWSLGPWTLERLFQTDFLYEHEQCCRCVLACLFLCECGAWIAPKKKTSDLFFKHIMRMKILIFESL